MDDGYVIINKFRKNKYIDYHVFFIAVYEVSTHMLT